MLAASWQTKQHIVRDTYLKVHIFSINCFFCSLLRKGVNNCFDCFYVTLGPTSLQGNIAVTSFPRVKWKTSFLGCCHCWDVIEILNSEFMITQFKSTGVSNHCVNLTRQGINRDQKSMPLKIITHWPKAYFCSSLFFLFSPVLMCANIAKSINNGHWKPCSNSIQSIQNFRNQTLRYLHCELRGQLRVPRYTDFRRFIAN